MSIFAQVAPGERIHLLTEIGPKVSVIIILIEKINWICGYVDGGQRG